MYDLILKNCNIVNEDKIYISDIAIKDERIALINPTIDSEAKEIIDVDGCLLYTSPSPRDRTRSRMPSSA